MLLEFTKVTKEQLLRQKQQCEQFAGPTAEAIGAAGNCLFSLLPYEERFRQAASWYDACALAMLRGNYAPLNEWIRQQACTGAEQHFKLEDFLELLRICRRSAINVARWDAATFSEVDEVINEGLLAVREKVPWNIHDDMNYLDGTQVNTELALELDTPELTPEVTPQLDTSELAPERDASERRAAFRNRLAMPIRVRVISHGGPDEEITHTQNVSRHGVYFITLERYRDGSHLEVTYPYWAEHGGINRVYPARIARLDRLSHNTWGVAVEFLQDLHKKTQ
jgi:hypothetical protein